MTMSPSVEANALRKRRVSIGLLTGNSEFDRGCGRLRTDPLVGHGRHFGRSVHTFCRVHTLLTNSLARNMQLELGRITEAELSDVEVASHRQYLRLLALSPGLEERLNTSSEGDLRYVADMITKGITSARSDDTKSLKVAVVDWITPSNEFLSPPLHRNVKSDRGFFHPRTGELLCPVNYNWSDPQVRRDLKSGKVVPSGDMWPRFLFKNYEYNPEDPWDGLLRSSLLVKAYKHVFTSPSSVYSKDGVTKSTKSSNARIHGMTSVTIPSIAYIATQIRFALSSGSVFSRTDKATDSEFFYNLIIEVLEDPDEYVEVVELLRWWNQFALIGKYSLHIRSTIVLSPRILWLTKIKERRQPSTEYTLTHTELERHDALRSLSQTCVGWRRVFLPLLWETVETAISSRPGGGSGAWYKQCHAALISACNVLVEPPSPSSTRKGPGKRRPGGHLASVNQYVKGIRLTLTKHHLPDALEALVDILTACPNLKTVSIWFAQAALAKGIKDGVEGHTFKNVETVVLPSQAHAFLKCSPNVREVRCWRGVGPVVGAIYGARCRKVEVLTGVFRVDEAVMKSKRQILSPRLSKQPRTYANSASTAPRRLIFWLYSTPSSTCAL
ncbi:hypothetical protein NMY22_g20071 [Coprinellus aureogranulatus]|nr:hypothetical protein NMY22_g20071 [Coprinellus aureogranulatus]